jgi:transcriptional regulator with XRE-family HTH domain
MVLTVKEEFEPHCDFGPILPGRRTIVPTPSKINVVSKKDIGERLRAIRNARGMSQAHLARLLGTHQTGISQVEVGRRALTLQQVVKLARALRVSVDEIVGRTDGHAKDALVRDRHLIRRMQLITKLPVGERKALLKTIDAFLRSSRVA